MIKIAFFKLKCYDQLNIKGPPITKPNYSRLAVRISGQLQPIKVNNLISQSL